MDALASLLEKIYPSEVKALGWNEKERRKGLLNLAIRAAEEGAIQLSTDSLAEYERVESKRQGRIPSSDHTAVDSQSISQSIKGQARTPLQEGIDEIIDKLKARKLTSHETAKELWPAFISALEDAGLEPDDHADYVLYGPEHKSMGLAQFSNRLSEKKKN